MSVVIPPCLPQAQQFQVQQDCASTPFEWCWRLRRLLDSPPRRVIFSWPFSKRMFGDLFWSSGDCRIVCHLNGSSNCWFFEESKYVEGSFWEWGALNIGTVWSCKIEKMFVFFVENRKGKEYYTTSYKMQTAVYTRNPCAHKLRCTHWRPGNLPRGPRTPPSIVPLLQELSFTE